MKPHTVLAVIGDTQIGSSTALAPPKFEIHVRERKEIQVVQHNRLQQWLWSCWTDYWDYVKELIGLRGKKRIHRLVLVHMGDVIDGNHLNSKQVITEIDDQIKAALDVLRPLVDMSDAFYGILGTEAHANKSSSDEAHIYQELEAIEYGQQLALKIDGLVHDFAHKSRVGYRSWTSAAAGVAIEVAMDYVNSGLKPPAYIWRAHNHMIDDSGYKIPGTRAITIPSWQLKNSWAWSVAANRVRSDIGGFIVNCGILDDSRCRYMGQPDGRRVIEV